MIKRLLLVIPIALFTEAALDVASNSAPASSSGAPGETDCTTSGCHDTYQVNSGPGSTTIGFENGTTEYEAGQTYSLSVTVNHENLVRYGFQLVALDEQNQNTGNLTPIDNSSNQVTTGYNNLSSRRYMTYTYKSTLSKTPGSNAWMFKWTAPADNRGKITFYVAGLAANNNGNDGGDYCYTKTASLDAKQPILPSEFSLSVAPNPAADVLNIKYNLNTDANVKLQLLNPLGQVLQEAEPGLQAAGQYSLPFNLVKEYGEGLYTLRLVTGEKIIVKKIMLAK